MVAVRREGLGTDERTAWACCAVVLCGCGSRGTAAAGPQVLEEGGLVVVEVVVVGERVHACAPRPAQRSPHRARGNCDHRSQRLACTAG